MPANVSHFEGTEYQRNRAFSPVVISEGGKTIWLAGQTTTTDQEGMKRSEADTGAVTLIQRFGSAANLNIFICIAWCSTDST